MPTTNTHDFVYIGLGANLPSQAGTPEQTLDAVLGLFGANGLRVLQVSPYYSTVAITEDGLDTSQPRHVNAVAEIMTGLNPVDLMQKLMPLERYFGRKRLEGVKIQPRSLDLDIIDYKGQVLEISEPVSVITPHPRMLERAFVLWPLSDICPDWRHPVTGANILELAANVPDQGIQQIREGRSFGEV